MENKEIEYRNCKIRITNISGCYTRCRVDFRQMSFRKDFGPTKKKYAIIFEAKSFIDHLIEWKY